MSATTPSRLGLVNNTGTDYTALFLKQFAGEVLTTFETSNVFKALHTVRTISQGKSAQFPVTGIASASYHVAGENILDSGNSYLSQIKHAEKVINIDSMLTANTMIYELDEAMNHYDVRSIYTTELGRALALKFDKTIAQVLALSARGSSLIGGNGGTVLAKGASGLDTGTEIADAISSFSISLLLAMPMRWAATSKVMWLKSLVCVSSQATTFPARTLVPLRLVFLPVTPTTVTSVTPKSCAGRSQLSVR